MSVAYTVAALQGVVGPHYRVRALSQRGSFQVNLELTDKPNDFTKVARLQEAFNKLREAGYDVKEEDFRIATAPRERNGVWQSWCSIFVNQPAVEATTDVSAQVAATVLGILKGLGITVPAPAPEPPKDAVVVTPPEVPI